MVTLMSVEVVARVAGAVAPAGALLLRGEVDAVEISGGVEARKLRADGRAGCWWGRTDVLGVA